MKPIYEPKGKAKEYGDYALNIYTGCPHRCYYCFAPSVLRRDREKFHSDDADRVLEAIENCADILDKVKIGKLNYYPSTINWAEFGRKAEVFCKKLGLDYYIKDSLRKEMEAHP